MSGKYDYLFYTLMDEYYSERYSVNLSGYDDEFKERVLKKCLPLTHMDLVRGNFIVWSDGYGEIILYKVISVDDDNARFIVSEKNQDKEVFYDCNSNNELCCISHDLSKNFFLKVSLSDIKRIVNDMTEEADNIYESMKHIRQISFDRKEIQNIYSDKSFSEPIPLDRIARTSSFKNIVVDEPTTNDIIGRNNSVVNKSIIKQTSSLNLNYPAEPIKRQQSIIKNKPKGNWFIKLATCCILE